MAIYRNGNTYKYSYIFDKGVYWVKKCKVLVTGVAGQLGHDVMNELAKRGYDGIGTDIADSY